jgi:hypothetical protein
MSRLEQIGYDRVRISWDKIGSPLSVCARGRAAAWA